MAEEGPRRMRLFEHLEELRLRLKWSFLAVFFLFIFFAAFQIRTVQVSGVQVPYPFPDPLTPAASQFFSATLAFLKPPGVNASVMDPAEAFVVQLETAMFLAIVTSMPIIAYHFGKFLGPALYVPEKRAILRLVVPSVLLFIAGMLLAFLVLLPFTFKFLYSVSGALGATVQLLDLESFLQFTLIFTLGFAATFELPVVMYALTAAGIIGAATWRKYWRIATIGIFFFAAIITPDTSGVTMLLVAFPMLGLYVGGYAAAAIHERRRARAGAHKGEGS